MKDTAQPKGKYAPLCLPRTVTFNFPHKISNFTNFSHFLYEKVYIFHSPLLPSSLKWNSFSYLSVSSLAFFFCLSVVFIPHNTHSSIFQQRKQILYFKLCETPTKIQWKFLLISSGIKNHSIWISPSVSEISENLPYYMHNLNTLATCSLGFSRWHKWPWRFWGMEYSWCWVKFFSLWGREFAIQ